MVVRGGCRGLLALGCVALLASARSSNPTGLFKGAKYRGGASPSVTAVVDTEGKFEEGALSSSGEVKGVVTAYGNTDSAKLLDACFGTSFSKAGALVDAATVESCLLLNCAAQESAASCFASKCADVVLLSAWGNNGASAVESVRTLVAACAASDKRKVALVVVTHDAEGDAALARSIEAAAGKFFGSVSVVSLPHSTYEPEAHAEACEKLRELVQGMVGAGSTIEDVEAIVQAAWAEASSKEAAEGSLVAEYACDIAFAELRDAASSKMSKWRRLFAAKGSAPSGWSQAASDLVVDSLAQYDARTLRYVGDDSRLVKRGALKEHLLSEISLLQTEAVAEAAKKQLKRLQRSLRRSSSGNADGVASPEDVEALTREAEYAFDVEATRVDILALLPSLDEARRSFAEDARQLASDFGQSPLAQLAASKAEERKATKATRAARREATVATRNAHKAPKPRTLACAVQLVAMLRPRGFGNLQGFGSYAMGPHSLLFGFANDRDANPADMSMSDSQPLLRLQPKLNFDLDL